MKIRSELYTLFDDGVARMKLEFWRGRVFIHYFRKGTKLSCARKFLRLWPDVKAICRALGYRTICALGPDNKGMERLLHIVGFKSLAHENGLTYMEHDNA